MLKLRCSAVALFVSVSGPFLICTWTQSGFAGTSASTTGSSAAKICAIPNADEKNRWYYAPFQVRFERVAKGSKSIKKDSVVMRFFLAQVGTGTGFDKFAKSIDEFRNPRVVECPRSIATTQSQKCLTFDESVPEKYVFLTADQQRVLELWEIEWPYFGHIASGFRYGMVDQREAVRFSYAGDPINVVGRPTTYVQEDTAVLPDADQIKFNCR
jgi:hypothetical protein